MNRIRLPRVSDPAAFPALIVLLVAVLLPASVFAQTAPNPSLASEPAAPQPTVTTTPDQSQAAPIQLTPFQVDATKEKGYFSPNTLAGTRLNSNIADLPSSITVITKQQLEDTASVNINDAFMYEANVEGSRTYTNADINRNGVHDDLAGYDNGQAATNSTTTSANVNTTRVRQIGHPRHRGE